MEPTLAAAEWLIGRHRGEPDAEAIYESAMLTASAQGAAVDLGVVARMLHDAAVRGHAEAQMQLGICYGTGAGVGRDDAEAVRWVRKAADAALPRAQYWLARCYFSGVGVTQDYAQAFLWAMRAKAQGFGDPGEICRAAEQHLTPQVCAGIAAAVAAIPVGGKLPAAIA
jgi:TPR repeat protein